MIKVNFGLVTLLCTYSPLYIVRIFFLNLNLLLKVLCEATAYL